MENKIELFDDIDLSELKRDSKYKKMIDEFIESDKKAMKITEVSHKVASATASSIRSYLRRNDIAAVTYLRDRYVYVIRA